jgi:phytoene synthase
MTAASLAADHAACADVLRRSGSSFALPIRLLPIEKRQGTTALYAFCRRADDIVDNTTDPVAAAAALEGFAADLDATLVGRRSEDPVIRAVTDAVRRFAVPEQYLREILAGVRMDLVARRYQTFSELEEYCRRVATAVGLAAIHIWGFRDPQALAVGHACGLAFQLTNILRDIPEDLARGRIYLPIEDFLSHGCLPEDLAAGRITGRFADLASFQVRRAEQYFKDAVRLDRLLSTDGRLVFRAMHGVYRELLAAVKRTGAGIFTERVRPAKPLILGSAVASILGGPRT